MSAVFTSPEAFAFEVALKLEQTERQRDILLAQLREFFDYNGSWAPSIDAIETARLLVAREIP